MEYKDYYKTLGVARDADEKAIKQAYRKLARQYHPDVNPNDKAAHERFKEINEAYEVLSDPEKRRKYDVLGADWRRYQQAGGPASGFDWGNYTQGGGPRWGGEGFSDFFESLFSGLGGAGARPSASPGTRPRQPIQRGQDLEHPLEITLREAHAGTSRAITMNGEQLDVKIPPGVKTGSRVRLSGKGYPGLGGGTRGDLYIVITVLEDPIFKREGDDLHVDVPVDLYDAILGGEARVPTISGELVLQIPAGTNGGRRFRLRGKGMPRLKSPSESGDLLAEVQIRVPSDLSDRERELFQTLRDLRRQRQG